MGNNWESFLKKRIWTGMGHKLVFHQPCHVIEQMVKVILGCITKGKICKIHEIIHSSVLFFGKASAGIH